MRITSHCLALLLGLFVCVSAARAGNMSLMSIRELAGEADVVLQGRVAAKTCLRDPQGRIYTEITLVVTDVWKGAVPGREFKVVQAGGILGDERTVVTGQCTYVLGEEVVAYLRLNARGEGVTIGLSQGKFEVFPGDAAGEKRVRNVFHGQGAGATAFLRQTSGGTEIQGALTLNQLKQQTQGATK